MVNDNDAAADNNTDVLVITHDYAPTSALVFQYSLNFDADDLAEVCHRQEYCKKQG